MMEVTAKEYASHFGVTVQNARKKLSALAVKEVTKVRRVRAGLGSFAWDNTVKYKVYTLEQEEL